MVILKSLEIKILKNTHKHMINIKNLQRVKILHVTLNFYAVSKKAPHIYREMESYWKGGKSDAFFVTLGFLSPAPQNTLRGKVQELDEKE